ncbi:hypothetical protein RHSIM_Rhsim02G0006400 [Rhododendron simsii]|uniref:Retrotransposon gag domain-containing protein n=1 Tax=Rhododendron simsii TaxID=118357 RepID=A0A834LTR6_RHOSS|nr:hypothetical protein RHSIM_Rhsim02G0006400 [Rhododendron simsii]
MDTRNTASPSQPQGDERLDRMERMIQDLIGTVATLQRNAQNQGPPVPPPQGPPIPPPPQGPPIPPPQGPPIPPPQGPPNPPPQGPPPPPLNMPPEQPVGPAREVSIKEFLKLNPPTFDGEINTIKAEAWLASLRKIFRILPCTEQQQASFAAYQLQGDADAWWQIVEPTEPNLSWTRFEALFKERFIPRVMRDALSAEFQLLKQGEKMNVAEYATEFTRLSPYAPHLVDSEEKKTRRFEDGLRPDIAAAIKPMRLETYAQVFDRAVIVEQGKVSLRQFHDNKRKVGTSGGGNYNNSNKKPNAGNGSQGNQQNRNSGGGVPKCTTCGKNHYGACRGNNPGCFNCGQQGDGSTKRIVNRSTRVTRRDESVGGRSSYPGNECVLRNNYCTT